MGILGRTLAAGAIVAALAGAASAAPVTISFVLTGDISEMEGTGERGGFARLATIVNQERAAGHAYLIHACETFSPSPVAGSGLLV